MVKVEIQVGKLTNSCFVVMPFSPVYDTEYRRVIRPAVQAAGLHCVRADEIYSKPQVAADIWNALRSARVVIAELTGRNTNVFYEVGLAHALGKPVIIITRNEDDVPFDLKALRYRYYTTDDPFWGENLQKALVEMLQNVLEREDYGTVFEGIATVGKIIYQEEPVPVGEVAITKPSYDLTGVWQGTMEFAESHNCNLHLVQEGDGLSGTMIVSYEADDKLEVVQELMSGEVKDDAVSLYGVSYSYLQQVTFAPYGLDILSGDIHSEGNEISGRASDAGGHEGTFSLARTEISVESDTPSRKE